MDRRLETNETNFERTQQLMATEQNRRMAGTKEVKSRLAAFQNDIDRIKVEMNQLQRGRVEEAKSRIAELLNDMEKKKIEMDQLKTTISEFQTKNQELETRRTAAERRAEEAESRFTELDNSMEQIKVEMKQLADLLKTIINDFQRRQHELEEDSNKQRNELQILKQEKERLQMQAELNTTVEEAIEQQITAVRSMLTSALQQQNSIPDDRFTTLQKTMEDQGPEQYFTREHSCCRAQRK